MAIVCIGRVAGEDKDRQLEGDYLLTEVERQMLNDVCEAYHNEGKPVIVVLNVGNVIETESWRCLPDAILMAWQPGQRAETRWPTYFAVASVLQVNWLPPSLVPTATILPLATSRFIPTFHSLGVHLRPRKGR